MADLKRYKVNQLPTNFSNDEIYFEKKGDTVQMYIPNNTASELHPIASVIKIYDNHPDSQSLIEGVQWYLRKPLAYDFCTYIDGEIRLIAVIPR
ncbi:hypothetical protein [Chryseobacterium sp.]|uniref:hypothetical protein n=1 Tax=Chryseobacterium sp. TaxID=1871047 RepID=UPI0035ADB2A0